MILDKIVDNRKKRIAERKSQTPLADMGTHYTSSKFTILSCQEAYDGYVGVCTRPFLDALPRSSTS
ncbi:MAG: hypothetical protein SVO26_04110, partial [Chloroflexota bacterium]|nr:hypothetical protein [Chloroflexota bacterium]